MRSNIQTKKVTPTTARNAYLAACCGGFKPNISKLAKHYGTSEGNFARLIAKADVAAAKRVQAKGL